MGEVFETEEESKVMGIIAMREKEILITGSEIFMDYIIQGVQEVFGLNRYEENDSLFMGMRNIKKEKGVFQGISTNAKWRWG